MAVFDLCIIGAGMFGSAAARHASANPCLKICLIGPTEPDDLEKKTIQIQSSHYDEGRIVHSIFKNDTMAVLAKHTMGRFRELEKLSGIEFYSPVGCILSPERNSYIVQTKYGKSKIPYVDLTIGDTLRKRFPYLSFQSSDHPLLDDHRAGVVSPRKIVEAEKKVARLQGCDVVQEIVEEVSGLIDGVHMITTTTGKVLKSKRVLFCTGAFTKFKNLTPVKNLKYDVHRETAAMIKIDKDESERLSAMPAIIIKNDGLGVQSSLSNGAYILPPVLYPDGHYYLKIGHTQYTNNSVVHTLEEVMEWYNDVKGDADVIEQYSKFLFKLVPDLRVEGISSKTCVTSSNPTGLPYIDRITPTVTVAVVGNGQGAMVFEEVGRIAAELSISGKWDSVISKLLFEAIQE